MAIRLGTTQINAKYLGSMPQNKIMLGMIEIFPNIGSAPAFDPSDLFVNGELGLFYNFNEAGLNGLVTGPELNPQPDFNAAAGWTVGSNMTVSGGALRADTVWSNGQSSFAPVLTQGKTYLVEVVVSQFDGAGQFNVSVGNAPSEAGRLRITSAGTFRAILQNDGTSAPPRLAVNNSFGTGMTIAIDRLSCVEVLSGYQPTQFQLSTGSLPVGAPGHPIGLTLDLKYGKPVELLADPEFDNPTDWFETVGTGWSVIGGQAVYANNPAVNSWLNTTVPTMVPGRRYLLRFTVLAANGGYTAMVGGTQIAWLTGAGERSGIIVAGAVNQNVIFRSSDSTSLIIEKVSLVEITTVSAAQATAAARPQFNTVGDAMGAIFDGVDDGLASGAIDLTTSPVVTVFFGGVRRSTSRAYAYGQEPAFSGNTFSKRMPENGTISQHYWARYVNGVLQFVHTTQNEPVPEIFVDSCVYRTDIPGSAANVSIVPTLNGDAPTISFGGAGSGAPGFSNDQITMGKTLANGNPCSMEVSYYVVINRECTPAEHAQMDTWGKAQLGITS